MTSPNGILENHTVVVSDGRILDLLPNAAAALRYTATLQVERSEHLLLPGLIDAHTQLCAPSDSARGATDLHHRAQLRIAQMLKTGTTCFCSVGGPPETSVGAAIEQGLRAVIGVPITAADDLTRALHFRDEYRMHPLITTAFAPRASNAISDATFGRIATFANELDVGVLMALHDASAEVSECIERHGMRPIERLQVLGLLTPALTAAYLSEVTGADFALAERSGIAITLCPESSLRAAQGLPPVGQWLKTALRCSLGSGVASTTLGPNLWNEMRLLALTAHSNAGDPWNVLATATRGGASVLGLDAETGTLQRGKWADLCCIDLRGPALQAASRATPLQWLLNGGDDVSDVWVAGRHLLNDREFTRLDWPRLQSQLRETHANIR
jgi:5-methylthioadenosine/S-adenosylhomocysteine deaminase